MTDSPVSKALLILKVLARHGQPVGVSRVAEDLGLNASTVHRLLQVLVSEGMASYDPASRLYAVGTECIRLATAVLEGDSQLAAMRSIVRDLAAELQETCAYFARDPQGFTKSLVIVERGPRPLGYDYEVGERDGLHAGASGKAILAYLPDAEIERMFSTAELAATTERTIVDRDALRREVALIRARGVATSMGERVPGAGFGVAAPVFGAAGHVAGSAVVTIPTFRWRDENLPAIAEAMKACGRRLSAMLGGAPAPAEAG